jgi:hypothetical protein
MSGTLTVEQSNWLEGLIKPSGGGKGDVAKKSDAAGTRLKTRQQVLDGVLNEIDTIKGKLAPAMQAYELIDNKGKSQKLLTSELNPDDEIDTRHDARGDSRIKDEKVLLEIGKLVRVLNAQEATLRDSYANPDGTLSDAMTDDPLFTEDEIADEIWTPLVRAGLFPENLVKKKHSEVAKMFAAAQEEYNQRLEAFRESGGSTSTTADNLGLGAEIATSVGKIATGVLELESFPKEIQGVSRDTIKNGIEVIAATGEILTVAQKSLSRDGGTVLAAAQKGVKLAIAAAGLAEPTQKLLEKAFESAVHGGKFVSNIVQKKTDEAIGSLADALAGSLETVGSYYNDDSYKILAGRVKGSIKTLGATKKVYDAIDTGETDVVEAITELAKEAGDLVAGEIKGSIETEDRLRRERELKQITDELDSKVKAAQLQIEQLTGACLSAAKVKDDLDEVVNSTQVTLAVQVSQQLATKWQALLCSAAKGQDPGGTAREMNTLLQEAAKKIKDLDQLREEIRKGAGEVKAKTEEGASKPEGGDDGDEDEDDDDGNGEDEEERSDKEKEILGQLSEARNAMTPEVALLTDAEAKARLEAMQKDAEEFARLLGNDFAAAVNETDNSVQQARLAVSKLAPLIEKLKKDKAYLKLADTLASVSLAVGKAMFETLNPAGSFVTPAASFKECATNIYSAINHMTELAKWEESMADSRNAGASALVAAEFHRAGLEKKYRNADWINGAIKAVETIGAALKVSGIAAPLGTSIVGGTKAVGETAKLVTKFYNAQELKKAWEDYEAATLDPEDRKKVRQALRSNATLAKYALAWAAVTARDPLARDAMRKIGLSDAVLADKDTNAQAVVEYMETMFAEDPVVLRTVPNPHDWWPGKPMLTSRNWMKFLKAAEETDKGLQGQSAILITQLLVRMEKLMPAALTTPIDEGAVKAARAAVDELIDGLRDYVPLDSDDDSAKGMRDYADVLQAQAELRRRSLPAVQEVTV